MASTTQKTASTHRSAVVRGTREFHIVGGSGRKRFASAVSSSSIKSGSFLAGGHSWALACRFDNQGSLASITLELLGMAKDVVATAGIRIEDPLGEWPSAVWQSDAIRIQETGTWELSVPHAYHGHESRYLRDDRLTIECTVDVLEEYSPEAAAETRNCFVSVVPPPTIAQDLQKLLLIDESKSGSGSSHSEERRRHCMQPDVTFVVEETEIQAHKLVLAMRSPVFAAEFRWHTNHSANHTRLSIDDMSASTFRAMLRFIYTDELPMKSSNNTTQRACKEKYASRRREAMARDLLVAADRYDLERLRLMCQNILLGSIDASTVMGTLLLSTRSLRIAAVPIIEILERVAMHNGARNSSDGGLPKKTWSAYNASVHGAHEFRIPNFCAVQRRLGVGQGIYSGTFQVGDHDWMLMVYPSGEKRDSKGNISVYLKLFSEPPAHGVRVSGKFIVDNPSEKFVTQNKDLNHFTTKYTNKVLGWGYQKLMTVESAKSQYLAQDGSLTIYAEVVVTKQPYPSTSIPTTRATIMVPPSSIALQLEQLLVGQQGSDLSFLVEGCEIRAHGLVIAARLSILYETVAAAAGDNNDDLRVASIDGIKAIVFKAVLHFVYTDELPTLGSTVVAEKIFFYCHNMFHRWSDIGKDVVAVAGIRMEDPLVQW
ncbi:hypothetical protein ACQ4PT_002874 [Festuca glaucescens]